MRDILRNRILHEKYRKELEMYTKYEDKSDTMQADINNFNIKLIEMFLKNTK